MLEANGRVHKVRARADPPFSVFLGNHHTLVIPVSQVIQAMTENGGIRHCISYFD